MIDIFFDGNSKVEIMKYCKRLETISFEYDVLIFMARKSICFFDALVLNGELRKAESDLVITTSSRILNYDCEFLKDKKIALIDDIVLKGNTLYQTINFLLEKEIKNFHVYYIASQSFENANTKLIKKYLKEPILELENNEILVLGNAITSYISASACSYNVDYPVFYMDEENDFVENYIKKNNCISIPSDTIGEKTSMYVQNFDCKKYFEQFDVKELNNLQENVNEAIIKFRIFYRNTSEKRKVLIIPIIVLPALSENALRIIFHRLVSFELCEMVKHPEKSIELSNMLSVIQYVLSYQLFVSAFQNEKQYDFKYSIDNQDYVFPQSYRENIIHCLSNFQFTSTKSIREVDLLDDFFCLSNMYNLFFDFIGNRHKQDFGHNVKFTFKEVYEYCSCFYKKDGLELQGMVSTLFDYAIDTGLIVPETIIKKGNIIRAYRLSEQYELHEKEFDLIIYMYDEYQSKTQKEYLGKILTEKLLVLFFKEVITKILNQHKNSTDISQRPSNLFGITYTRFGPVVSDSSTEIGVSKDSYLTKRLFDESRSPFKRLYLKENTTGKKMLNEEKVYVKQTAQNVFGDLPQEWKKKTRLFVNQYTFFEELLTFYKVFDKSDFIKSFDKFLIISAIGKSKDNQLLSLAAELKIFQTVVGSKKKIEDIISAIDSVMDGMVSGIWKYICYKNSEYENCYTYVAKSIEAEEHKFDKYTLTIESLREDISKLKEIEKSSVLELLENVKMFLSIYSRYYNLKKSDEQYKKYVNIFNKTFSDTVQCSRILKSLSSALIRNMYETIDVLSRKRESINQAYLDVDKLENLFSEQNNSININTELMNIVEKLMDESAFVLYEILIRWNYIIEYVKNEKTNIKISSTDKNLNYLRKVRDILCAKDLFRDKTIALEESNYKFNEVILRIKELEYEIDILLFCINKYIMKNNTSFVRVNSFYVIKRDDGNKIELEEILATKDREKPLNKYLGIADSDDYAAFVKSKQSQKIIQNLTDFSGYTLLDYECKRGCNTIIKVGEQCYSARVKHNVAKILDTYENKKVEVRDK